MQWAFFKNYATSRGDVACNVSTMFKKISIFLFFGLLLGCKKESNDPVVTPDPSFTVLLNNRSSAIFANLYAFLSDSEGKTVGYAALPSSDTLTITAANVKATEKLDLTVVRVVYQPTVLSTDTVITIETFTELSSGKRIEVGIPETNFTETNLTVRLTNLTTLDSIIVPNGQTYLRPTAENGFLGSYQVLNWGKVWLRVLTDGHPYWRFMYFDNVQSDSVKATVPVNFLPETLQPTAVQLPFNTNWQYAVEGVVNENTYQLMPLGDLLRAPGGLIQYIDQLTVYEPNLVPTQPYSKYRIAVSGTDPVSGEGYACEQLFSALPSQLPGSTASLTKTILADNRLAAVNTNGDFDVLTFRRVRSAQPRIQWETYHRPGFTVSYNLPVVPTELALFFPALSQYAFDPGVRAQADTYENLQGYDAFLTNKTATTDAYWRTKMGYIAHSIGL